MLSNVSASFPGQPAARVQLLERQAKPRAQCHDQIGNAQLQGPMGKHREYRRPQHCPRILQVAQAGRENHDEQPDPEQRKESTEVVVLRLRVEVRHPTLIAHGGEESSSSHPSRMAN